MTDINEMIGNEIADAYNAGFKDGKDYGRELIRRIEKWAKEKDLLHEENADKQFMKFIEEAFEFKSELDIYFIYGYIEPNFKSMMMEMGDVFVTLIILCKQLQMDPIKCLEMAQEKIKGRKGKTIRGTFVKEEDL